MTIRVDLDSADSGSSVLVSVNGHANGGPRVCAAVSTLTHALARCCPADVLWRWGGEGSGEMELRVPIRMVPELRMFLTGLALLDTYEPGHLVVTNHSGIEPPQVTNEREHNGFG